MGTLRLTFAALFIPLVTFMFADTNHLHFDIAKMQPAKPDWNSSNNESFVMVCTTKRVVPRSLGEARLRGSITAGLQTNLCKLPFRSYLFPQYMHRIPAMHINLNAMSARYHFRMRDNRMVAAQHRQTKTLGHINTHCTGVSDTAFQ